MVAAWRPGEEGGHAIVNILTGKANPSAKLAQSWPRTVGHVHSGSTPWLQRVRGKWVANSKGCGYDSDGRCYDPYVSSGFEPTPLFYFGAGLSYTTYSYSALTVTPAMDPAKGLAWGFADSTDADAVWRVSVTVTNTGKVAGQEVVQIYVKDPDNLPFVPYWKRTDATKSFQLVVVLSRRCLAERRVRLVRRDAGLCTHADARAGRQGDGDGAAALGGRGDVRRRDAAEALAGAVHGQRRRRLQRHARADHRHAVRSSEQRAMHWLNQ